MTEIVFYENPDDLIKLYNDGNDTVDNLVSRHIFVCLANESFSIANTAHPVFNIQYLNTLVRGTGATAPELPSGVIRNIEQFVKVFFYDTKVIWSEKELIDLIIEKKPYMAESFQ